MWPLQQSYSDYSGYKSSTAFTAFTSLKSAAKIQVIAVAIQTFIGPVSDEEEKPFSGLPDFGGHNRGSKFVSWKYSFNEDAFKYFLE